MIFRIDLSQNVVFCGEKHRNQKSFRAGLLNNNLGDGESLTLSSALGGTSCGGGQSMALGGKFSLFKKNLY